MNNKIEFLVFQVTMTRSTAIAPVKEKKEINKLFIWYNIYFFFVIVKAEKCNLNMNYRLPVI